MVRTSEFLAFKIAILTIPATILTIIPTFSDPINLPKLLVLVALTLNSSVLYLSLRRYRLKRRYTVESKFIVSLYIAIALTMVLTAFSHRDSLIRVFFGTTGRNNGLLYFLSAIVISLIIINSKVNQAHFAYVNKIIAITSVPFVTYSGLQFLNLDPIKWTNPYNRVIGTLGNPNFSSSLLAIFSIYWLNVFLKQIRNSQKSKLIALVMLLTSAFLSWSTASVQGLVVLAAGAALVSYMWFRETYSSRAIPLIFIGGGIFIFSALFISFSGFGPLGATLEQYTLRLRGWYASFGIKAMLDHPLNGVGVDNYISAFRQYRTQEFVSQYGVSLSTNNAHSTPAQLGATFGAILFSLYIVLQLFILVKAILILNSRSKNIGDLKRIAIIWILAFAQSLLSIEIIGLGILNWLLGAVLLSVEKSDIKPDANQEKLQQNRKTRQPPAWVTPLTIFVLVISSIPVYLFSTEDRAFKNLASAQVVGPENAPWVKNELSKVSRMTISQPEKVMLFIENLYRAGLFDDARITLEEMHKMNPEDVYANDLLASYFGNIGDLDSALQIRENLRSLDPLNYQLELVLARIYAEKKDIQNLELSAQRIRSQAPGSVEAEEAASLIASLR